MSTTSPDDDRAALSGAQAYVHAWAERGRLLDAQRLGDLRALSEFDAAQRFARLLSLPLPYPLRPDSGLVEQQRIFARLRSPP